MQNIELWTIRTLAYSALVNSDPKMRSWSIRNSTTGRFGPRPLVISDPLLLVDSDLIKKKFFGQFGPFLLVNSDLFHGSIRTFSIGQLGPFHYVFYTKKTAFRLKTNSPNIKNEASIHILAVQSAVSF